MNLAPALLRAVAGVAITAFTVAPVSGWSASAPHVVELRIAQRAVTGSEVSEDNVVVVTEGEDVEIVWQSDEDATVHLHGYDIEAKIAAGAKTVVRFTARATGRFPIEAHRIGTDHNEVVLVYLEVHPR
jgi:hypothetical protein